MDRKPIESGCHQADAWISQTLLVRRWEEMKREILLHKWYESEKAGYDIGWDRASIEWMARFACSRQHRS
jgi:hypothetical protein